MGYGRAIKVSERVYRNVSYAGRVYGKGRSEIIEKLLDAPLICPHCGKQLYADMPKSPLKSEKKPKLPLSNIDDIKKGVELLQDVDSEIAKKCIERLNEVLEDKSPFKGSNDEQVTP